MDLFVGYRLSHGETRTVRDAPVHYFESQDLDAFISYLCLGLFYCWDFEILSRDRSLAVTVSHDGWIEYRFARGQESVIPYFEKYFAWLSPEEKQT
jgi:hypothetical protein